MKLEIKAWLTTAAVLAIGWQTSLRAAGQEEDKWQFTVTPFLWGAALQGDVSLGRTTVDVDIGFDKIVEHLNGALMLYLEVRKQKFGFYASPMYIKLEGDGSTPTGGPVNFEQQLWVVDLGGFYNLGAFGQAKPVMVDVIAGARYWNNHLDLDAVGLELGARSIARNKELIDPLIGLRFSQHFTAKFSWSVRGDVGGFDISNSSSDLSWQALGLLGYDLSKRCTLFAGYRALATRKEDSGLSGRNGFDLTMHGPILGLALSF